MLEVQCKTEAVWYMYMKTDYMRKLGCVRWDEGVSQLEGQAENEGDRRIHRGDMHTKKRWIWTNTTLIPSLQ